MSVIFCGTERLTFFQKVAIYFFMLIIRELANLLTNNVKFERQGVLFMQIVENVFDLI